jgi:hypothetical protein
MPARTFFMANVIALSVFGGAVMADTPKIEKVQVSSSTISVTLSHPDTGWEHYADGWEVLDADGNRLGFRELLHPHVNEQPFTRSLSGVTLPEGATVIYIRARDSVAGWAEETYEVILPGAHK